MINDHLSLSGETLQTIDSFPGWQRATFFLEGLADSRGCKRIVDLGGGANPMLSAGFVRTRRIYYALLDISQAELDKAPLQYARKICVDLTAPPSVFAKVAEGPVFDLAFSHMFLEHVVDPVSAHRNILSLLKPGGLAVHMYPSGKNLPLIFNRFMPERVSAAVLRLVQPGRVLSGAEGKFPAYYRMCGNPSRRLRSRFEALGYEVVVHRGFVGHDYYKRIPGLRDLERLARQPLATAGIGMTSAQLLILRKR